MQPTSLMLLRPHPGAKEDNSSHFPASSRVQGIEALPVVHKMPQENVDSSGVDLEMLSRPQMTRPGFTSGFLPQGTGSERGLGSLWPSSKSHPLSLSVASTGLLGKAERIGVLAGGGVTGELSPWALQEKALGQLPTGHNVVTSHPSSGWRGHQEE